MIKYKKERKDSKLHGPQWYWLRGQLVRLGQQRASTVRHYSEYIVYDWYSNRPLTTDEHLCMIHGRSMRVRGSHLVPYKDAPMEYNLGSYT